jgi:hypothetical protein
MAIAPVSIRQYHVFLASPGDVNDERHMVRQFFEHYNRHTAQLWGVRFEVIDWENYATIGVGRPQELITAQTLERFRDSLALVIGIMGQRFGSPTGKAESGTEEEFNAWLLEQQGTRITDRAPVVALCANIVKDASGVAELKPQTRQSYRSAVEGTLAAFRPRSGVPDKTQLEILEALGQLGAVVKPHLIDATKSGLYPVRRRAIEILLPHLSDDELFSLDRILSDRSREPIKTFLIALLERDVERAIAWLLQRKYFGGKACEALGHLIPMFAVHFSSNVLFDLVNHVFRSGSNPWGRIEFLRIMAYQLKGDVRVWQLIRETATKDPERHVRQEALKWLAHWQRKEPATWELIREATSKDRDEAVRGTAITLLATGQEDHPITWELICEAAMKATGASLRSLACGLLLRAADFNELHKKMMLGNLDEGWRGWYDPKEPVTSRRVAYVA